MFTALSSRLAGLRVRYAEPHRAYHTQAHVDAMLSGLSGIGPAIAAELAIWYHDAIYDPAWSDNEARSAALLRTDLAGLADPALLDRAEFLVRLTATHRLPDDLPLHLAGDAALFLDLDMAVLGSTPSAYDAYERDIAAEYEPVHGPERFVPGRAAFLSGMLDRPRLFLALRNHDALDAPARANMRRALRRLSRK